MTATYDVIIVGAGPTGLTLANLLGQSGVRTLLVERNGATVSEPRAVVIDDEAMRTFQSIGLSDAIMARVRAGKATRYFSRVGARGRPFAEVNPQGDEFGFPKRLRFHQPDLEAVLREGVRRWPNVEVRFDTTAEIKPDDAGVTAELTRGDHSDAVRAAWCAAADGGSSRIRRQLDIPMSGDTYDEPWLVLDLVDDPFDPDETLIVCDPRRPTVSVPGPRRRRRFEFLIKHGEDRESFLDPTRIAGLLQPYGYDAAHPPTVERKTVYAFHARCAQAWRRGRVLLIGDAAHMMPPFMGQGMNSCIRDAHNLAWKLAAVVRGEAGEAVLDTYEAERRPHVQAMIDISVTVAELAMTTNRLKAAARDVAFRAANVVPRVRRALNGQMFKPRPQYAEGLFIGQGDPRVGRMTPQPRVRLDGREARLDEFSGPGWALIGLDAEPPAANAHALWGVLAPTRVRLSLDTLAGPSPMTDWLRDDAGRVLLVRPDRYVAGAFRLEDAHVFASGFIDRYGWGRAPERTAAA